MKMPSKVRWRPDELSRDPRYRRSQIEIRDRLANQDGCITFLLVHLRALQKRVNQLETWRARSATASIINQPPRHPADAVDS
jgi:hypothetical protein